MNQSEWKGFGNFILVEKIVEDTSKIRSINNKSFLSRGKVLENSKNKELGLENSIILYLQESAIEVTKQIEAVNQDFIIAVQKID